MSQTYYNAGGRQSILQQRDDDVVIVAAVRTALTKGKKGGFKDTRPEEYLSAILKASIEKSGVNAKDVEDIQVGNVLPPGGGATAARMAALAAGIPEHVSISTVNRQCSSGLTAVSTIANQIIAGQIDIGIGAGVESMTFGYGAGSLPDGWSESVLEVDAAEDCLLPMGITSENVAADYGITRQAQDKFAAESFRRASEAQKAGKFVPEIVPVKVKVIDPKTEEESEALIDRDDGIRAGVTEASLAKLKPAFSADGTTHAGNASQVSDGAAAVVLTRRSHAKKLGLKVLGKYVAAAVVGVPPRVMGIGPAFAIPALLKKVGLDKNEVDFYEINEAFASQAVYSIEKVGLSYDKVNLWGGAIAMGHPLGATGARQVATGLNIAKQTGKKIFVSSMCIGSGMGMAALFVSEQ